MLGSRGCRRALGLGTLGLGLALVASSCGGGSAGDPNNRGPFKLLLASTGFGQIYPHQIRELDAFGVPTTKIIDVGNVDVLKKNLAPNNAVLPVATFGTKATLPGGANGNQFLMLRFSHELAVSSLLQSSAGNSGMTGSVQVLAFDPVTETQAFVSGKAFVGGKTFFGSTTLVEAVRADDKGNVSIVDARATGFPLGFTGDEDLVQPNTLVFVPDTDGDLTTFERFPNNRVIRILITSAVQDLRSKPVIEEVCTATGVGVDAIRPNVLGYTATPQISPGNGQLGVDPRTTIRISFSKPVQPRDVGAFFDSAVLTPPSRGVTLNVTLAATTAPVLYYADPLSASDLCSYTIRPAYFFPGFVPVTVNVATSINSLAALGLQQSVSTTFNTGKGPGLVNAPVAPEAIYVGRGGSSAGLSVIDLNGFGQGTGDIGDTYPSRFLKNPNLGAPRVNPPELPGTTNADAGGEGVFTVTRDTNLSDRLLDESIVTGVDDIHIGQPLDKVFNNESLNENTTRANQLNPTTGTTTNAWGNSISIAPVPNPPKLLFPPPNPAAAIFGQRPAVHSSGPPFVPGTVQPRHPPAGPCLNSPLNRLVQGDPDSDDVGQIGIFGGIVTSVFVGPQPPPGTPVPPTPFCPYLSRQQIGHFLYVLDRGKDQVLVVNSNRMTVLETIQVSDPFSMALSPNLRRLAVTNFSGASVTFIDTDPASLTFNTVVGVTEVGNGPTACAWQPEGEDLLVLNSSDNSMTIIGGADLQFRKTVKGGLAQPIEVAVAPRQGTFGFQTGTYFAYILNRNGSVAIFESGPDGTNGIGFDDIIGVPASAHFRGARSIMPDGRALNSAVWIGHVDDNGLGTISHFELTTSFFGPIPVNLNSGGFVQSPTLRQREWTVNGRLGGSSATTSVKDRLSGNAPVDLAVDDIRNFGAAPDLVSTQVGNIVYADHSGKGIMKGGAPASNPRFLFVALGDRGRVDVLEIATGKVLRRIDMPGVRALSHYWRQ